eukprot:298327_1
MAVYTKFDEFGDVPMKVSIDTANSNQSVQNQTLVANRNYFQQQMKQPQSNTCCCHCIKNKCKSKYLSQNDIIYDSYHKILSIRAEHPDLTQPSIKYTNIKIGITNDLLIGRKCWTGEFLFDLCFYMKNHHPLLGIFFHHPYDPLNCWKRISLLGWSFLINWFFYWTDNGTPIYEKHTYKYEEKIAVTIVAALVVFIVTYPLTFLSRLRFCLMCPSCIRSCYNGCLTCLMVYIGFPLFFGVLGAVIFTSIHWGINFAFAYFTSLFSSWFIIGPLITIPMFLCRWKREKNRFTGSCAQKYCNKSRHCVTLTEYIAYGTFVKQLKEKEIKYTESITPETSVSYVRHISIAIPQLPDREKYFESRLHKSMICSVTQNKYQSAVNTDI